MGFFRWVFLGFFGWVFLGGFFNANPASVAGPCHVVTDPAPDPAIFGRDKSPYTFPGGVAKIVNKNAARVAEVPCIAVWRIRIRGSVPVP